MRITRNMTGLKLLDLVIFKGIGIQDIGIEIKDIDLKYFFQ